MGKTVVKPKTYGILKGREDLAKALVLAKLKRGMPQMRIIRELSVSQAFVSEVQREARTAGLLP